MGLNRMLALFLGLLLILAPEAPAGGGGPTAGASRAPVARAVGSRVKQRARTPVQIGASSVRSGVQTVPPRLPPRAFKVKEKQGAPSTKPAPGSTNAGAPTTGSAESSSFTLLYNETPSDQFRDPGVGADRYIGVYQATDPNAVRGTIDARRVLGEVRRIVAENPGARWGMLDFEDPYNEILLAGPSDPRHAAAVASMVTLVRAVRREFPEIRWTYYGMPRLPYWTNGHDWSRLDAATRRRLFDEAQASYGAILRELDWIQPSVYDKYERALGYPLNDGISGDAAERAFRTAHVEVVRDWFKRSGEDRVPLIPVVSPWFLGTGKSTLYRAIPDEEFLAHQVGPLLEAGVDGISIWSSMRHKIGIATIDFTPNSAYSRQMQPLARAVFATDVLGRSGIWQVDWTSSAVKRALESHSDGVLEQAMRRIDSARRGDASAFAGAESVGR